MAAHGRAAAATMEGDRRQVEEMQQGQGLVRLLPTPLQIQPPLLLLPRPLHSAIHTAP